MQIFILFQTLPSTQFLQDGGPRYTETDLSQFIVEPFNTLSAFLFLVIAGYWVLKLRGSYKKHLFLTICLPILIIGGIGGVIYHAFRASGFFLVMDWLPILVLCMLAGAYFLYTYTHKDYLSVAYLGGILGIHSLNDEFVPVDYAANTSYSLMAVMILFPIGLILKKTNYSNVKWVLFALLSFGVALFFRIADSWVWFSAGTHFLWHTFGAFACHFMITYIYKLDVGNQEDDEQNMPKEEEVPQKVLV